MKCTSDGTGKLVREGEVSRKRVRIYMYGSLCTGWERCERWNSETYGLLDVRKKTERGWFPFAGSGSSHVLDVGLSTRQGPCASVPLPDFSLPSRVENLT